MDWEEDYISSYGGMIEDDVVSVDAVWGEVEIEAANPFFNDNYQYTLEKL